MKVFRHLPALLCLAVLPLQPLYAGEWSGNIAAEYRYFPKDNPDTSFHSNSSLSAQPEFYHPFENSRNSFTFEAFLRKDQQDDERSHADIRKLYWQIVARDWEMKLGIAKVYWGKTETAHLVDIINQTDAIENVDGEDKLGQAMINLTLIRDWGNLDLFVLPGFRERRFPDINGRPSLTPLPVSNNMALYDSSDKDRHIDYALRWSHSFDIWDIGIAHFTGTSRDPRFDISKTTIKNGQPLLMPIYDLIQQSSIDLQATSESWIWKAEVISRSGQNQNQSQNQDDRYTAAAAGFEYTFVGIMDSNLDIGLVTEYLYDSRQQKATTPFENDLATGLRFAFNDIQSTEILAAIITDINEQDISYFIEASRRISNSFKLSLEMRGASHLSNNVGENNLLQNIRRDKHLQLELAWYF